MRSASIVRQTFKEHLLELRARLQLPLLALFLGAALGYFIREQILFILVQPLNQPLYYTSPAGGLDFTLKISFFFGLVITTPIFIYQIFKFVEPATSGKINKFLPYILLSSMLLMIVGMMFAYYISLPATLYFLVTFSSSEINSLITTTEYFSFVTRYVTGLGILFQLPLILLVVNAVKKLNSHMLLKFQKWALLGAFVVAAVLTPTPDIVNQFIMALPLIALYELSMATILILNKIRS